MRAFVAVRQLLLSPLINPVHELQREVKELKESKKCSQTTTTSMTTLVCNWN